MGIDDVLKDLNTKIVDKLPKGVTISDLEFEGPELVIYTTDPKAFADNGDIIRSMAKDLRKRGFVFTGPVTVYAAMQACGLVNDHLAGCFARAMQPSG